MVLIFISLMIHDVDLVCALLERGDCRVTSIHGRGECVRSEQTDFATCLMDFGGGAHAVIHASRISQNKERSITVHTKESCVCADLLAKTLNVYRSTNLTVDLSRDNSYVQDGIVQRVYVPIEEPLRSELVSFYDAVINGAPIAVNGKAAVKAIQICEKVADRAKRQG